ncbi:hypothetical protein J2752_000405 [Halarchaeum rubridurum]|uniref:Uncharacterized protein n=1 Tax=Halarchaeum rubridurum TaxID=489911 RepID=A0A830FV23_9EURY|nr:hypothetical protein [Halarchaeum rubridurum]MBP1953524.1 hypothetical protein [Halarchaeum rubridurum]GGM64575.1 hypothetical protein GCM10009017_13350 [Halarchaeum rubridurum]
MAPGTVSRRRFLALGGAVAVGSLAGCLNRAASSVTNTGASPAAVFAGTNRDDGTDAPFEMARGGPHVSRLTPTVSAGSGALSGAVELEGWVTSSAVTATDYNSSRSNRPRTRAVDADADGDADGDGVDDATEDTAAVLAYLDGDAVVAERFAVCLPDAAVPGGNGSIREAVTPQRLVDYMTGRLDGEGRVYSWGTPEGGPGDPDTSGDCDDGDPSVYPGAVCGTSPHLVADVTGPTATDTGLEVVRVADGSVLVVSSASTTDGGSEAVCATVDDDPCGPGVWARTTGSSPSTGVSVYQVLVQPPACPRPFPALLYVQRCESDGQLIYTGGWVIDDAALYGDSVTVLSMAGASRVVGVGLDDLDVNADGDGLGDGVARSLSGGRAGRGARLDVGDAETLVARGVLSKAGNDVLVRKKPGRRSADGGDSGSGFSVLHLAVDAPVLHLVNAGAASASVKFKAGAELSKAVN